MPCSAHNDTFSRAAALSALGMAVRVPHESAHPRGGGRARYRAVHGLRFSGTWPYRPGMLRTFSQTTARLMEKGLLVDGRIVPNGGPCEACWEEQLPFLMQTLLYERA